MTLTTSGLVGSVKVVVVGSLDELTRGRAAEFRYRGLTIAMRPTALGSLLEVGRDPDSVVLVPTDLADMPLIEFIDVLRSVAHVPVIAGVVKGCSDQAVSELFDHGISSTVALPATPDNLAEAVGAARRLETHKPVVLEPGSLSLDEAQHRVTWLGHEVYIGPKRFEVLQYLMLAYPRVVTIGELVQTFERGNLEGGDRVRRDIGSLRAAFKMAAPDFDAPIETIHRVGYRLLP